LDRAPGTLQSLQRFLGDLRTTTRPLGPAARAISATAPGLTSTLAQLDPFQRAAEPALRQAIAVAPSLTRLGDKATPVIRRANPTLASLSGFAREAAPVTRLLDVSIDDTMGVLEGWARAIQDRDGVGHMFHGKATIGPDFFRSLVNAPLPGNQSARRATKRSRPQARRQGGIRAPRLRVPEPSLDKPLRKILQGVARSFPKLRPNETPPPQVRPAVDSRRLLDYLLGP
jgi:ABC-type transporter Mla subunit MlaD